MDTFDIINGICNIPEGTQTIGAFAFKGCTDLKVVNIPASVEDISDRAFLFSNIDSFEVDPQNSRYSSSDGHLFVNEDGKCNLIKGCVCPKIPEGTDKIGAFAFYGCTRLQEIFLPKSVTFIGMNSFSGCSSLRKVSIPKDNNITYIDTAAFNGCSSLEEIALPNGIDFIDRSLFKGCSSIKRIKIPEGVEKILAWAFCGCINLSDISLPKSLTELENAETIFDGCNLETINIDPDNKHFIVKGNCLLSNDEKRLIRGCNNSTIPESVRVIGMNAFKGCLSLKSIDIPDSVETIEESAFEGCKSLSNIKIGNKTKFEDKTTFKGCPNAEKQGLYKPFWDNFFDGIEREEKSTNNK